MRWLLRWIVVRMGSRAILAVGGTLFLLNMLVPDPLPFVDEFLMLAGTILLSRWARREGDTLNRAPTSNRGPKNVGRGSTQSP